MPSFLLMLLLSTGAQVPPATPEATAEQSAPVESVSQDNALVASVVAGVTSVVSLKVVQAVISGIVGVGVFCPPLLVGIMATQPLWGSVLVVLSTLLAWLVTAVVFKRRSPILTTVAAALGASFAAALVEALLAVILLGAWWLMMTAVFQAFGLGLFTGSLGNPVPDAAVLAAYGPVYAAYYAGLGVIALISAAANLLLSVGMGLAVGGVVFGLGRTVATRGEALSPDLLTVPTVEDEAAQRALEEAISEEEALLEEEEALEDDAP